MRLLCFRFDGDLQYNDNNNQQNGHVLNPPRGFADNDANALGIYKLCLLFFVIGLCNTYLQIHY